MLMSNKGNVSLVVLSHHLYLLNKLTIFVFKCVLLPSAHMQTIQPINVLPNVQPDTLPTIEPVHVNQTVVTGMQTVSKFLNLVHHFVS